MNSASKKKKVSEGLKNLFSPAPGQDSPPEKAPEPVEPPVAVAPAPAPKPALKKAATKTPATTPSAPVDPPVAVAVSEPKPAPAAASPATAKSTPAPELELALPSPVAGVGLDKGESGGNEEVHLVVFTLGGESYGLDISVVESIIKLQSITIVPHAHAYIEGVTNLRGTVLSVIDLRTRFGLPRAEPTRDTRIVVVENGGINIGLIVDAVTEVIHVPQSAIEPPSLFVVGLDAMFITGIAKLPDRLLTLIDLEKMFAGQERADKLVAE